MITISVAMATFNGAKFISQQLDSIARQTVLPNELVITDDGSTDETLQLVEQFSKSAPFPVHVWRNEKRLGYRANFMTNFGHCQSDVIAVCDQDDIWDPLKLAIAAAAFEDPDVVLFCHDAWLVDANGARLGEANVIKLPPRNPPLSFYPLINPLGFAIVFRRSLCRFAEDWNLSVDNWESGNRMAHDQWLCFLASVYGTIAFSDRKLTDYRQHASNTYGWKSETVWARWRHRLRNPGQGFKASATAAAARAAILERAPEDLNPVWRQRARTAARQYRLFADRSSQRACIYLDSSTARRISAIRSLVSGGAYRGETPWDLSGKALAKDLVFGMALRGLLTQPHRDSTNADLRSDLQPVS